MPVPKLSELSCGAKFAKLVLFVFNFVIWVVGAAMFGVGIWVRVDPNAIKLFRIATVSQGSALADVATVVIIIIGAIVFVIGFLGCCGAIRESVCMLTMYAGILIFILILQAAAGIMAAVFRNKIMGSLKSSMTDTVVYKYKAIENDPKDALSRAYDYMQVKLKCCGVDSYRDWEGSAWHNSTKPGNATWGTVPHTCCKLKNANPDQPEPENAAKCQADARKDVKESDALYVKGCHDALMAFIQKFGGIIIGVAFGFIFIQIIGVVIACCLRNAIRKKETYQYA